MTKSVAEANAGIYTERVEHRSSFRLARVGLFDAATESSIQPSRKEPRGFFPVSLPGKSPFSYSGETIREQSSGLDYGTEFQRPDEKAGKVSLEIPLLENVDMHDPLLTSKVRSVLIRFWATVISKALQTHFPLSKTTIGVSSDPSEGRRQLVLRLFTEANANQAVSFWDGLETDMREWVSRLDDHDRELFSRTISLRLHWR